MTKTIKVMPAKTDGRVLLWEVHPAHPAGEVFIKGDETTYLVAQTTAVTGLLERGQLVKIQAPEPQTKKTVKATKATADGSDDNT